MLIKGAAANGGVYVMRPIFQIGQEYETWQRKSLQHVRVAAKSTYET